MNSAGKILVAALTFALVSHFANAQNTDKREEPLTISEALKLNAEGLAQYTGYSEGGLDDAAYVHATAKRIETEHALAQKNLRLVISLHQWREVISECRRSIFSLAYIINGGGTMYVHGEKRDCAAVEDFLTELSKSLPLPEGKGDAKAGKVIDDTILVIKNLHADSKKEQSALANEIKRIILDWRSLKSQIEDIPAEDAKKIAAFATDPVSWWLMNDEDGEKYEKLRSILKSP
ncbi:MAG TPA: hypothetical protein VIU10_03895 [Candidatus Udaeobacter sp.]